jgi:hypothetical protein
MRERATIFLLLFLTIVASHALLPAVSLAIEPDAPPRQAGEDRWVPSLAITGGAIFQDQEGLGDSVLFEDGATDPVPLRGLVEGDDFAVSPFVGASLELMAPALPIPTRPRFFVSGEVLPTFGSDRDLALEGDPDCVRGSEPKAPCVPNEEPGQRVRKLDEDAANGVGTNTTATVETLVFGANLGVAFPVRIGKRQLRIKPSVAWINYEVSAEGLIVNAACAFPDGCARVYPPGIPTIGHFLRQPEAISAKDSQRFNGIGPGLDIEMDAARYGPLGASIFLGMRAYYIVGDRTMDFGTSQFYNDRLGTDVAVARFNVEVDPWLFRAHVGIRIHWLGSRN